MSEEQDHCLETEQTPERERADELSPPLRALDLERGWPRGRRPVALWGLLASPAEVAFVIGGDFR